MRFLLDTDICIHVIRRRSRTIVDRFMSYPQGTLGISSLTLAELSYGAERSTRIAEGRELIRVFAAPLQIAAFDEDAAAQYGLLRAFLEGRGQTIGALDLLIAAHALSLRVPLVTHNLREFRKVPGLDVQDWM